MTSPGAFSTDTFTQIQLATKQVIAESQNYEAVRLMLFAGAPESLPSSIKFIMEEKVRTEAYCSDDPPVVFQVSSYMASDEVPQA